MPEALDSDVLEEYNTAESSLSQSPQQFDSDTFRQRNDPQTLLFRYRLQLMNAYTETVKVKDELTGKVNTVVKIRRKKDSNKKVLPMKASKEGIEDIISYIEKFINNHTVQGNIDSLTEYRNRMRYISQDITGHFMAKRNDWGIALNDIDMIISNSINIVDLFLTRALFNEERKSYGETYKETTHTERKPEQKQNVFQKVGSAIAKGFGQ